MAFLYIHNYLIDAINSKKYPVSVFLYTCVPLSPSSIIWYRPRVVIFLAGKVTPDLVKSSDNLLSHLWADCQETRSSKLSAHN